jgi:hypothetical protein
MTGHAKNTVGKFYWFLWEVCVADLLNRGDQNMIGEHGIVVEIDESKYSKRKYHRGKRVEGNWVFGAIERLYNYEKNKYFAGQFVLLVVEDCTKETLGSIIKSFIRPGSFIISDCWSAYIAIGIYKEENVPPLPRLIQYNGDGKISKKTEFF